MGVYYHFVIWDSSNRSWCWRVYYHVVMWNSSNRRRLLPFCDMGFIKQRFTTMLRCGIHQTEGVCYHFVIWDLSNKGFPWACLHHVVMWHSSNRGRLLPFCDMGFIKQRVPLGVFTTMLRCGIHQTDGVYYHFVIWDSSNKGFPWARLHHVVMWDSSNRGRLLQFCDLGFIKHRVPLGVFTTML